MQFQLTVATLVLTSLFIVPVQAAEDEDSKQKRAAAKLERERATASPSQSNTDVAIKSHEDIEFEGAPADYYKKLELTSF